MLQCPRCRSTKVVRDLIRGETFCTRCGDVLIEGEIDLGKEWRTFERQQLESRTRTGPFLSFGKADLGTGTMLGKVSDLQKLPPAMRKEVMKMRNWQIKQATMLERNLRAATAELRRLISALELPAIIEEDAGKIYRSAAVKGLVRGRSMESVIAAAVYIACKRAGIPKTLSEMKALFKQYLDVTEKDVGKTYRFLCRQLGIRMAPTYPEEYVYRYAERMRFPPAVISKAIEIIKKAREKEITSGKGPTGIAAAALYIAALIHGIRKTQREISEVAGVTEVTIRNRYKEIIEALGMEDLAATAS